MALPMTAAGAIQDNGDAYVFKLFNDSSLVI